MTILYIDMLNVFPNNASNQIIYDNTAPNGKKYASLYINSTTPSNITSIIENKHITGLNIFIFNSNSLPVRNNIYNGRDWATTISNPNAGLSLTWTNDKINGIKIWADYFSSLKLAFPNIKLGVTFGGQDNTSNLSNFISDLNTDKGFESVYTVLKYFSLTDFIEFDIETDWNFDNQFGNNLEKFMENISNNDDYKNIKIRVGATNPVGSSRGKGTGSNGTNNVNSECPTWITKYNNMEFIIYTYGKCTSSNLFETGNPWIPTTKNNGILPSDKKNIQFAITAYDPEDCSNTECCNTENLLCSNDIVLCKTYEYLLNGITENTEKLRDIVLSEYGGFNIFWLAQYPDNQLYPFNNITSLLNNIGNNSNKFKCVNNKCIQVSDGNFNSIEECSIKCKPPDIPTEIKNINITNNFLNITYS